MEKFTVGDVIVVQFPFSDLKSQKYRPALVVANAEFDDVIVCQITSSEFGKKNTIKLTKKDFLFGSLPSDSYVRPDKLFTLGTKLAGRKLGQLKSEKRNQILAVLRTLFS